MVDYSPPASLATKRGPSILRQEKSKVYQASHLDKDKQITGLVAHEQCNKQNHS